MIASWARTSHTFSTAINSIQLPDLDPATHYVSTKAAGWISKRARCRETPRPEDARSYLLMSEPIPLRDGHSRRRPRRKGGRRRGSARRVEKLGEEEEEEEKDRGWCVLGHEEGSLAITRTLFPNTICCHLNGALVCSLRLLVFSRSRFLCTASHHHRVFISSFAIHGPLSSLSIRCGYVVVCTRQPTLARDTRVSDHASFVVRKWTNWRVRWLVNEGWVSLKDEAIVGSRRKERRKERVDWWIHYNVLRCICCYWNLNQHLF